MERRTFLRWATHGLGAVFAAVLGVPAVVYLIDPLNRPARERGLKTVARLGDLPYDVPTEAVIRETTRDAWVLHPDEVVGRVWLVRRGADGRDAVEAYSTTCPHLGCSVNYSAGAGQFLCPCHGGRFRLDGGRIDPGANPAPRDMDSLRTELAQLPGSAANDPNGVVVRVEFKKFKPNQAAQEEV